MNNPRILITGDRGWTNVEVIQLAIKALPPDAIVIHGAASGADTLAATIATSYGLATMAFPAQWARFGKRAGPIRNQRMLDEGKPDFVVAFHNYLPGSKGTRDMVTKARLALIPVQLFNSLGQQIEVTDELLSPVETTAGHA